MRELIRESRHLVHAAGLFLAGVLIFLIIRAILMPAGFGSLGHYRPGALDDAAGRPLLFAGRAACEGCHSDIAEARKGSKHEGVACEACHGALAAHAADPTTGKPAKPDVATICLVCHTNNVAKPKTFPQVDPKEHSGGESCGSCHKPHHPEIS